MSIQSRKAVNVLMSRGAKYSYAMMGAVGLDLLIKDPEISAAILFLGAAAGIKSIACLMQATKLDDQMHGVEDFCARHPEHPYAIYRAAALKKCEGR